MNTPLVLWIIVIVIIILIIGGFLEGNRSIREYYNAPEIIETRDFSCSSMTGFTFKYPVFKGWESGKEWLSIENTQCALFFDEYYIDHPKEIPNEIKEDRGLPYIKVIVKPGIIDPITGDHIPDAYRSEEKNPHNINYGWIIESENGIRYNNGVWFQIGKNLITTVELWSIPLSDNFPRDQYFKTVIESFFVSPISPMPRSQALNTAQDILKRNYPDKDFAILKESTVEKYYGWIIFYTTRKYIETKDTKYIIPGNGPMIVMHDGGIHFLTASIDTNQAIQEFENEFIKTHPITKNDAIEIAKQDALKEPKIKSTDFWQYEIIATLNGNNYDVGFVLKTGSQLGGGMPEYVIDRKTGDIISKHYSK